MAHAPPEPTPVPTPQPSPGPTPMPSLPPSPRPTKVPTLRPTPGPSENPTLQPSFTPSESPSDMACSLLFASVEAIYYVVFLQDAAAASDLDLEDSFTSADAAIEKEACDPVVLDATVQGRMTQRRLQGTTGNTVAIIVESLQVNNDFMFQINAAKTNFLSAFNAHPAMQRNSLEAVDIVTSLPTPSPT
ncbi:expressed unknown protein [Seminavis robusta]|uniref:Uncharacterized protein n=1 Tax=Seminavis robusta TaxID=568900 RepID=A0A9N8ELU0_9STRA|nr:expressed unknown protein [Seminavis robusta]|eukprot:Sro1300_g260720.1 n/a (189) ;mRNA; r:8531-9097